MNVKELITKLEADADRLEEESQMLRGVVNRIKMISVDPTHQSYLHPDDKVDIEGFKNLKLAPLKRQGQFVKRSPKKFTGLRDRIRYVLKSQPRGLRPKQVAEKVIASGFEHHGKTPFKQLVAGELARMRKGNQLQKTEEGEYMMLNQ